ncbi:hypothetical protein NEOLEDRAFT_1241951 [Neolentinus lepideus HHB14362 ss-1]|uniref:HAUS augmin-like complex subunit 6 N-terminal domain-containing protein n=1 Tax=Neolentinus lepideus HHB14362 ss-1 TaxID=1314782 RepID=A0A165SHX8_9AGAM|nr:hypothetical protein NEOLEDRAFT_1241951 [Neolentinus lepideus HHB14362 ss-1]
MDIPALPIPLLLLLHLHLLNYPYANNLEYDENIFNGQSRGIRERAKTMEDICHFLVGKIEGNARSIFSVYPCLQPADSTAFRTSLTKYLESVRHRAIDVKPGGSNAVSSAKDTIGKSTDRDYERKLEWWWKDVMVRKSLLEECSGDKFERLMLALSTHAFAKMLKELTAGSGSDSSAAASVSIPYPLTALEKCLIRPIKMLGPEMIEYSELLASIQSSRRAWERSAAELLRQQADLKSLRDRLAVSGQGTEMKYDRLTTDRLLMLADSRQQDLLKSYWKSELGQSALNNVVDAAGVRRCPTPVNDVEGRGNIPGATSENKGISNNLGSHLAPQSLPIAAAHHPVHMRKLEKSVFDKPRKLATQTNPVQDRLEEGRPSTGSHALITMAEPLDTEKRIQRALQDALARTRRVGNELGEGMQELRKRINWPTREISDSRFELWTAASVEASAIDFNSPLSSELLATLSLAPIPSSQDVLEDRIRHIRGSLLPPFPDVPRINQSTEQSSSPMPIEKLYGNVSVEVRDPPATRNSATQPSSTKSLRTPHEAYVTSTPPKPVISKSTRVQKAATKKATKSSHSRAVQPWTDGKHSRRKSKVNLALTQRKTHNDESDKIVDDIQNISTSCPDDIDNPIYATPKQKSGSAITLMTRSAVKTKKVAPARRSLHPDKVDDEPDVLLPKAPDAGGDAEWTDDEDRPAPDNGESDEDQQYEGNSMSLADILLRVGDTTQFDLLDGARLNLADQSMAWG